MSVIYHVQIPNLKRGHIEECGHWTQVDKPVETNNILISWLKETHEKAAGVAVGPKLWGRRERRKQRKGGRKDTEDKQEVNPADHF